jgi:hypothetical protein
MSIALVYMVVRAEEYKHNHAGDELHQPGFIGSRIGRVFQIQALIFMEGSGQACLERFWTR